MSGMQKRRMSPKPQPGCLGRMIKMFDMDGSTAGNKLLMDKPYSRGSSLPSCSVKLAMPSDEDELFLSQFKKTSGRTPMKMLLDHELSTEPKPMYTPPNLVARLMGLDTLPPRQINTICQRKEDHVSTMMTLEEPLQLPHEPGLSGKALPGEGDQYNEEFVSETYHQHGIQEDDEDELEVAFDGNKCVEPGHLSTNQNQGSSEECEGVSEILKTGKDLFFEVLQQPNSLFAQHLRDMATRLPCGAKHISVLKPSKTAEHFSLASKNTENCVTKPAPVSLTNVWSKTKSGGFPVSSNQKGDDDPQPTRIVLLKPTLEKANHTGDEYTLPSLSSRTSYSFMDGVQPDSLRSREMAKEITNIIRESLGSIQMDDSFNSSVLSSGYNGDESSPGKSENEYATESDCEVMSPTSRHSWGYIDQFASCSSTVSCEPHAQESSVSREAKRRLSRRWNAMGLNGNSHEQRHACRRSSNTLGDVLALSEIKKSIKSPDNNEEQPMGLTGCLSQNLKEDETSGYSSRILVRSKSVPLSVVGSCEWVSVGSSHPEVGKSPDEKESQKTTNLKHLVTSLLFARNQKSEKEITTGGSTAEVASSSSHEGGLYVAKPVTIGILSESQDQPSPISVLEPFFADDDSRSADSSGILGSEQPDLKTSVSKISSQMIGKSHPIGSVARTTLGKNSCTDATSTCPLNLSLVCSGPDEEQDWCILVQELLSAIGLHSDKSCVDWRDATEMQLDPLLRDPYANASNVFMHEAKLRCWRSNRKLIFDSVNQALKDIHHVDVEANIIYGTKYPQTELLTLVDQVWAIISDWISEEVRCVSTDDDDDDAEKSSRSLAVDRVVRTEVASRMWLNSGSVETNAVRIDIHQRLLDELLLETVLQLTAR